MKKNTYAYLTDSIHSSSSSVSLYIHIPFCSRKCSYCSFYSIPLDAYADADKKRLKQQFLGRITEDIQHFLSEYTGRIDTVYLGGGDPGQLNQDELNTLLSVLNLPVSRSVDAARLPEQHEEEQFREVTIEMNPEHISPNFLVHLADAGITRFSFGIQTCSRTAREYIGRNGTLAGFTKYGYFLKELQRNTTIEVNTDIIASIPYQTIQDTMRDIDFVIEKADPKHISLYDLTFETGTPLADRIESGKNRDLIRIDEDLLGKAWEYLEKKGYRQYEISNFCRDDAVSIHNMNYWTMKDYIGFGPGAVSSVFRNGRTLRFAAGTSLKHYIQWGSRYGEFEEIDQKTSLKEYFMMHLRTVMGADLKKAEHIFGKKIESLAARLLNSSEISDMILIEDGKMRLKRRALLLYNTAVREIFTCIDGLY